LLGSCARRSYADRRRSCNRVSAVVSPWRAEGGEWLRAALHAHSTNSDGELSARGVTQHYGRGGYDVVGLTDHWHRSEAPSTADLLVLPGVELNCLLPEDRDGHVLGIGIERDPAELEGERRGLAETAEWIVAAGGVAYLAHPYWTGVRRRNRGLQCGLRARGRARPVVRPLGRVAPGRPLVSRARDRRQPPSGLRLRPRVDLAARGADGEERALRTARGPVLRQHRAGDPRRRVGGRRGRRALHAVALGDAAHGQDERHRGQRRPPWLPVRRGDPRHDGRRADRRGAPRPAGERAVRARRGRRRIRPQGVDEPALTRAAAREALARTSFDLLVIGGGVIGAATAAHAAREGLSVALLDAGDFGSGTSSASSKLIHGGLRYLRLGDVRLVREAHHERRTLTGPVAPHLVHRLPFLLPLYRGGPFRPAFVQSGILLYSTLALSRLNWLVQPDRAGRLVPELRRDGLRSCALYADAWTNDARLCLENVAEAAAHGATVLNRAEVVSLSFDGGHVAGAEVGVDGETVGVRARVVINAAGPWVDHVRRLEDPRAGTSVRLSKGAHVLVPGGEDWTAALTVPQDDVRVTFAVPWYGLLLLGTTDSDFEGDPADVAVEEDDIVGVLGEAATALPSSMLDRDGVRAAFAGLRVLPL